VISAQAPHPPEMLCLFGTGGASLALALQRPLHFAVRTTVPRAALLTEESKSLHAIGYSIVSAHRSHGHIRSGR